MNDQHHGPIGSLFLKRFFEWMTFTPAVSFLLTHSSLAQTRTPITAAEQRKTILASLFLSALLLAGGAPARARPPISKEYQIKAVCLFNFAQFVAWPAATFHKPDDPFRIGVLGDDPFGSFLDETVQGEKVDGHPLVIERYDSVADAKDCQILFISGSESNRLEDVLDALKDSPILTVSDMEGFSQRGGVVRFLIEKNKIHLKINLAAAKRSGLDISSKVLRLADIVEPGRD
jgi:hypothetical protein